MATKKKKKVIKFTEKDKQIQHLETLLGYTLRCLDQSDQHESLFTLFTNQSVRLYDEIRKLENKQ